MRSRLMAGRSPLVTIAVALALCAGAATFGWGLRSGSRSHTTLPARALTPLGDGALPRRHTFRERKRAEPRAAPDPVAAAFERGVAAYNVDDADAAADAFEEAVRLAPDEPEAHINLGLVYLRLQRPEDGMRELATGNALAKSRGER